MKINQFGIPGLQRVKNPPTIFHVYFKEVGLIDQLSSEEYQKEVDQIYAQVFPSAKLLPGVEKLVDHLKSHRIPFGISTGSSREAFELKSKNLKPFFEKFDFILLCGSDPEVKHGKPAPDAFEIARLRFKNPPEGLCTE